MFKDGNQTITFSTCSGTASLDLDSFYDGSWSESNKVPNRQAKANITYLELQNYQNSTEYAQNKFLHILSRKSESFTRVSAMLSS